MSHEAKTFHSSSDAQSLWSTSHTHTHTCTDTNAQTRACTHICLALPSGWKYQDTWGSSCGFTHTHIHCETKTQKLKIWTKKSVYLITGLTNDLASVAIGGDQPEQGSLSVTRHEGLRRTGNEYNSFLCDSAGCVKKTCFRKPVNLITFIAVT